MVSTAIAVQRRDRPWVDAYVTVLVGSFAMPSTDALREAVTALADRYPDSRLTWSLDPTKRYWRNDRTAKSVVTERAWDDAVDVGARLDAMLRDESLDPPLTLIRYPNHIGLKMSHSVGDGRLFLTVIAAVLQTAVTGEVAPWPVQSAGRYPLIAMACRTFGRHPALLKSAIGDRVPHGDVDTPVVTRPWVPSRRTHHAAMSRQRADEIFAWGREFAPRASQFALQVTLVLRALKHVGLEILSDVRVVVDLRRYLGWRYVDGNFVAGVPMRIGWQMTPEQISSMIKTTNGSGRPLAGQIQASLRGGGTAMPTATSVDPEGLPRVTFSNMGRSPEIDSLPVLTDRPAIYAGSVEPDGPLGLTFLFAENSWVMTTSACFHDNVIAPGLVSEATSLMTSDPIGLLTDVVGGL
jgi:hypothetical protein